ncbi:MAG: hypothetical protein VYA17_13385 [Pseudomonadota bacterium]|nr:hypothetical protein [Pseudomonadota bacterium]
MTNHGGKAHGFSSPFVSQTAPSMALVLERLDELPALTPTKHRDLKSAIRSFCKLIGKEPAGVVANINWLHIRSAGYRRRPTTSPGSASPTSKAMS